MTFALGFPDSSANKESACNEGETPVRLLGQEDLLEKGATIRTDTSAQPGGLPGVGTKAERQWPSGSGRLLDCPEDEEVLLQQEEPRIPQHWHANFPKGLQLEGGETGNHCLCLTGSVCFLDSIQNKDELHTVEYLPRARHPGA